MYKILNQLKGEWREKGWKPKILAVLAGIEVTFDIFTPILIVALWVIVNGLENTSSYFIFSLGLISSLFRGIRVGWLK